LRDLLLACLRRLHTRVAVAGKGRYLTHGSGLHVGRGTRLWAPDHLRIGDSVYIGKEVHIEANCSIGDFCLIANRVAFVGRYDHDFRAIGVPIRFAPWVGSSGDRSARSREEIKLGADVWVGYGAILLTGVTVGRGAVVAAGAVVAGDVPDYAIVAGTPAKQVGSRLSGQDIPRHELSLAKGRFQFSERGREHFVVRPFLAESE
jgi:acetyltransferase-like isoleucine patch superfamily enzyme